MKSAYRTLPAVPPSPEGLRVRPDLARMHFSVALPDTEPERALVVLRGAVEQVIRRVQATYPSATLTLQGFEGEGPERAKASAASRSTLHGCVEVPLTEAQDFWARAQLCATLTSLAFALAAEAKRARPSLDATLHEPSCVAGNPESHRPELVRRWVAQLRELASLAEVEQARLVIAECSASGPVQQQPLSVDEVLLTLALEGRLGLARPSP